MWGLLWYAMDKKNRGADKRNDHGFYWVLFFYFVFVFVGSGCLFSAVSGAGDAVFVLLRVVVVVVAAVPALLVVEEARKDLWEVGATTSVVLWDVGGPERLIVGEDVPDAVRGTRLGCRWEGKRGCCDEGAVRSGDADVLALGGNLQHRVEGGVVLESRVEGKWGLDTTQGAVHEELPKALLADDLEVRGEGWAERGKHVWEFVWWECVVGF